MPGREIITKTLAFGLVAGALIVGGVFVLLGSHATNDYLNTQAGWLLILLGLATGGVGTLVILAVILDTRKRRREAQLHITPRNGPPALPPAWGMGDIGRPGSGVIAVGQGGGGGGAAKTVQFSISNIDVPLGIGYLLLWTAVGLIEPLLLLVLGAVTLVLGGAAITMSWLFNRNR